MNPGQVDQKVKLLTTSVRTPFATLIMILIAISCGTSDVEPTPTSDVPLYLSGVDINIRSVEGTRNVRTLAEFQEVVPFNVVILDPANLPNEAKLRSLNVFLPSPMILEVDGINGLYLTLLYRSNDRTFQFELRESLSGAKYAGSEELPVLEVPLDDNTAIEVPIRGDPGPQSITANWSGCGIDWRLTGNHQGGINADVVQQLVRLIFEECSDSQVPQSPTP